MTMNPDQKVAVVTVSSSGICLETSLTLARNGFLAYATMRSLEKGATINTLADKENYQSCTDWIPPKLCSETKSINF